MGQRKAVTQKLAAAYRRGPRAEKARILDELCELTDWHPDHARRALRENVTLRVARPRPARRPVYADALVEAVAVCWRVSRYPTGKRLAPVLPVLVKALRRDGVLALSDHEAAVLCQMSPATIDRRLAPARQLLVPRGRSHTKPGTLSSPRSPSAPGRSGTKAGPGS